jgi:predicted enzyme related to lactoylglutathione lyase
MDFKIELIPVPVKDVDRSVEFYGKDLGWSVDHDHTVSPEMRFVQVTPPGSACSICFGTGLGMMPQGSAQFIQVVVEDADAACALLRERGVTCSDVDDQPWGRFVMFDDPDGNHWALQQIVIPS